MNQNSNSAKIYTGSSGGELRISLNNTKQIISATNNKAKYYADLAEEYKNEAKEFRDSAQYYAEQNSDVTLSYIDSVKVDLENKISTKQDSGNYALKEEIPIKVSELQNDMEYTTFNAVIPEQTGNVKKVLCTDGEKLYWETNSSYRLFDTKTFDYILTGEDAIGWALQGTFVSKEVYPDFYAKVLEEKENSTASEVTLDSSTITMYLNPNGHQFYDITDKSIIDDFYNNYGFAWYYGVDEENERIFLPRNDWFEQITSNTTEAGLGIKSSLPQHRHALFTADETSTPANNSSQYITWRGGNSVDYKYLACVGYNTPSVGSTSNALNDIYTNSNDVQPSAVKKLLYICVGNTVVNDSLVNVGNVLSEINQLSLDKLNKDHSNDLKPYIKETYINGTSWYRLYSDGWCEQGGQASIPGNSSASVTLLKTFKNSNYNALVTPQTTSVDNMDGWGCVKESTSSIRIYLGFGTTSTITWKACGFVS